VEFLGNYKEHLSSQLILDIYKCVCAHLPYMKVNIFERKMFLQEFYNRLHAFIDNSRHVPYSIPKDKILELLALIPPDIADPPHFEPDVAHLLEYSWETVVNMVGKGSDPCSVVTGFPILSRYIHECNYDAVVKLVELRHFNCDILFICDKALKLPFAYVKKEGKIEYYYNCFFLDVICNEYCRYRQDAVYHFIQ
jgi:hypothetical protein